MFLNIGLVDPAERFHEPCDKSVKMVSVDTRTAYMLSSEGLIYLMKVMRKKGTWSTECSMNSKPSMISLSQLELFRSVKSPMKSRSRRIPTI